MRTEDTLLAIQLKYERLPGYEHLSQAAYATLMGEKLLERTKEILRVRNGKPSLGVTKLLKVRPGIRPMKTKSSGSKDHRPRVLSKDRERRAAGKKWYFTIYFKYKTASKEYREGNLTTKFPEGTYRPPLYTVVYTGTTL